MTLALMRLSWIRSLRKAVTTLLLGAVVVAAAESLAPELHDGDSGTVVHVDVSSQQHSGSPLDGHATDAAHLCHCLHAHVGSLPARSVVTFSAVAIRLAASRASDAPPSAVPSAPFRPPIG